MLHTEHTVTKRDQHFLCEIFCKVIAILNSKSQANRFFKLQNIHPFLGLPTERSPVGR
jgi:hypothetical protein